MLLVWFDLVLAEARTFWIVFYLFRKVIATTFWNQVLTAIMQRPSDIPCNDLLDYKDHPKATQTS
jgi:hypothetical protein